MLFFFLSLPPPPPPPLPPPPPPPPPSSSSSSSSTPFSPHAPQFLSLCPPTSTLLVLHLHILLPLSFLPSLPFLSAPGEGSWLTGRRRTPTAAAFRRRGRRPVSQVSWLLQAPPTQLTQQTEGSGGEGSGQPLECMWSKANRSNITPSASLNIHLTFSVCAANHHTCTHVVPSPPHPSTYFDYIKALTKGADKLILETGSERTSDASGGGGAGG